MKEIARMRLGVLRELKNVRLLIDRMERKIKSHDPHAIQEAYIFLKTLVIQLNSGELSPGTVSLNLELAQMLQEEQD